ncbi:MAG: hypothetical protein RH945_03210 [Hyphomonas sp.]
MAIKTVEQIALELIRERSTAASKKFRDAVKPIYGVTDKGDPEHIGTALLLKLPEGHFLLTAAHIIDWNASTTLHIGANDFLPMEFEAFITAAPMGEREEDHADFAIAPLDDVVLSQLSDASFITEAQISRSVAPTEDRLYTCLGYPNSKNKVHRFKGRKVAPSLGIYTSFGRPTSQLAKIATDDLHLLVDHNAKFSRDKSGKKVKSVALSGFSGGAMVDLGEVSAGSLTAEPDPKLAALLIEGHAVEQVILGTRLVAILQALREQLAKNKAAAAEAP